MNRIYFDHAATTPVDNRVLEAMLPYFSESFGNPSSVLIEEGGPPRQALDESRKKVADLVDAASGEIIFTASATEANNLAIKGLALAHKNKGNRILLSEIEHYSVMLQADFLRGAGFDVDFVKVDPYGVVDMADLKKKLTKGTILASIMHANMEIGTVQPRLRFS
jgi:cysteine desulfurase